jgi:hypothetical protein
VTPQFLPVPSRQEQCVVRSGPEDENVQDARALAIDGQPSVRGQQVNEGLGTGQRDPGGYHRQEPQHRAPVGDQEQHNHYGKCREQQRAVDPAERLSGVSGASQRSGDMNGEAA